MKTPSAHLHPTRRHRRLLAVLVAAALVVTAPTWRASPAHAATAPPDLATNGSFEAATVDPWVQYPANLVVVRSSSTGPGLATEGTHFADFPTGSSLSQLITGLKTNQEYVVTGSIRADSAADKFSIGLRYFDSQHSGVVESEKKYAFSQTWTRVELRFKTDATHSAVGILAQNNSTAGHGFLDNIHLYEVTPAQGITSPGNMTYYVSSSGGSDTNDGRSPTTAWKSFAKLNASTFKPGDKILLKGGDTWTGTTLQPRGSGAPGAPITLGKYGDATLRPILNAADDETSLNTLDLVKGVDSHVIDYTQSFNTSVYLYNQQYWTIRDLDVSNHAEGFTDPNGDTKLRSGILVMNDNAGTLRSISVQNNEVHDVLGSRSQKTYWGGAGIIYTVMLKRADVSTPSNFDGVLVEGNYVRNTNRQGIVTNSRQNLRADIDNTGNLEDPVAKRWSPWYPSKNVVIRNNYVKNVAGDGILPQVTERALVERNTVDGFNQRSGGASAGIWAWNADHTVFQFNEAFGGKTTQDGQGYDLDYGQTGTIYQYNYSHDNDGGFMLVCSPGQGSKASGPGSGVTSQDGVVRYNISQNDKARTFMFSGYSDGTLIYNNTLYQGPGINAQPINFWAWSKTYPTSVSFYNNIFYLQSAGTWNYQDQGLWMQNMKFDSNTIFGVHTTGETTLDANLVTTDPKLVAPGTGTTNTPAGGDYVAPSLDGYKLAPGSPAITSGKVIETGTGLTIDGKTPNGGRDYWGTPVPPGAVPNRGADNRSPGKSAIHRRPHR
ncbi:MAG TPA: right-handed parallel beta-helix repeat-containing protein [Kribbella sp.]|uniref:right-handed parallel beta-helix repeat-containing protein n=1 Tax=Kribbella sp. TaxID=1871183 RepID=UPI002D769D52|nr:right-handed parallel beta-helix repeat-containing protein [Kribbella sp.]HET6293895.1 right-handed parallel beta-helix repeat-containing protein [Kribbella sp.]